MLLQKSCEERILANYDAISLYLCICLCAKYSELMVERGIPAMDGYWDTLTRMLWHRFDAVMQLHNESVRGVDVKKMIPPPDTRPHYVGYFRFIYTRIVFFSLSVMVWMK
uniref:Vacuolar protein sorting-associated protein 52 homolog n=1 Tax=Ascaris lumbricoides TaxID=6252 RepID=A0A0M3HKK8_ASCLU